MHGVGEPVELTTGDGLVFQAGDLGTVTMLEEGRSTRFTLTAPEGAREPQWEVR